MRLLIKSALICATLSAMGCATKTTSNSATSLAVCDAWHGTLFLPSRQDTRDTSQGLNDQGPVYDRACAKNIAGAKPAPF